MSSTISNETNSKDGLQSIDIQPTRPARSAPIATAEGKSAIREYYSKGDWDRLESFCNIGISEFIKHLPSPNLSGSTIYDFHFGAIAFKNIGKNEKYLACLKVLFSLKDFASNLNSEDQELLNLDISKYHSLSKELGIDYLNNIQVAEVLKKSGCFIATACYGSYDAPEVMVLRAFRNEVLLRGTVGRGFVRLYYAVSPSLARFVARRATLKKWTRLCVIGPIVTVVMRLRGSGR
jgi:hypothetical protein